MLNIRRNLDSIAFDSDNMFKMSNISAFKADRDNLLVNGITEFLAML